MYPSGLSRQRHLGVSQPKLVTNQWLSESRGCCQPTGLQHGAAQRHPEPAACPCPTAGLPLPLSLPCLLPFCSHSHQDVCKKCQESTQVRGNPAATASRNLLPLKLQETQPAGKSLFQSLLSRQDCAGTAPGWPISSSIQWRGAGREDCGETPTPVAALSPSHHLQ